MKRPSALLSPGAVLAGRYTVVRHLASGGMGDVYEARDGQLETTVALKVLRTELTGSAEARARFRREIDLSRQVTHPNVCRIFDLGVHPGPDGELLFLTMELIRGETLADRLSRRGVPQPAEFLELAGQMAAALQAAHSASIVHRDFKPGNVLVVEQPGVPLRVVVTDFGLARTSQQSGNRALTQADAMIGTPAYLAPEQVEGGEISAATDVYALGLVLYELLTGRLPFEGETALQVAFRRVTQQPPSPRDFDAKISPAVEHVVLRCLARAPAERFQSAGAANAALQAAAAARAPSGAAKRRGIAIAVVAAALVIAGVLLARRGDEPLTPAPGSTALATAPQPDAGALAPVLRKSIAILAFAYEGADPEGTWLGTTANEVLAAQLAAAGTFRVIPPAEATRFDGGVAGAARAFSAELIVTGTVRALDANALVVKATAQAPNGQIVADVSTNTTRTELLPGLARLSRMLLEQLSPGSAHGDELVLSVPSDPLAAKLYARALASYRAFDRTRAKTLLEEAAKVEPEFPLTHALLAQVLYELDQPHLAVAPAQRAEALMKGLRREEQLWIESRTAFARIDINRSAEVLQVLFELHPDDVDVGLLLAEAQLNTTEQRAAKDTLARLRVLADARGGDARVDLMQLTITGSANMPLALELGQRALSQAQREGRPLVEAEARFRLANLAELSGDYPRAVENATRAAELYQTAGDRSLAARCRVRLAVVHAIQGRIRKAITLFDEIDRATEAAQATYALRVSLMNSCTFRIAAGEGKRAAERCELAVKLCKEANVKRHCRGPLLNATLTAARVGELQQARSLLARLEAGTRESGAVDEMVSEAQCSLKLAEGNGAEALRLAKRAVELADKGTLTDTGLTFVVAEAAVRAGAFDEALPLCRAATEEGKSKGAVRDATAWLLMSEALAGAGKPEEARKALAEATLRVRKTDAVSLEIWLRLAELKVQQAEGSELEAGDVEQRVAMISRDSKAASLPWMEMEARLVEAAVLRAQGDKRASAKLSALAGDAKKRGMPGYAQQALSFRSAKAP